MPLTLKDIHVQLAKHEVKLWAKAILQAAGDLGRMAENLGCSRQAVNQRVRFLNLEGYLNEIRKDCGLPPLSVPPRR